MYIMVYDGICNRCKGQIPLPKAKAYGTAPLPDCGPPRLGMALH